MSRRRKKVAPGPRFQPRGTGEQVIATPTGDLGWKYDERSNIGQQFGSQGTLFQVTQRPRTVPGWRGFSPARQDEVREKSSVYYDPVLTPHAVTRATRSRKVQDMVARSTAPLHPNTHILVAHPDDPGLRNAANRYGYSSPVAGYFSHSQSAESERPHLTAVVSESAVDYKAGQSKTLLHELGHADSYATGRPSSAYDTPQHQGEDEAYADDFSVRHARTFQTKKERRWSGKPLSFEYEGPYPDTGRGVGFREAYDRSRTEPVMFTDRYRRERAQDAWNIPGINDPIEMGYQAQQHDKWREDNPTLPGMEHGFGYHARDHYEMPFAFERRVRTRQDRAVGR